MIQEITLKVNGQRKEMRIEGDTPLIYVLRNDLGLKGAKLACGLEQCGACKVLIDGEAVPSCRVTVREVQGKEITTVEGLSKDGELHPLQEAFIEEGAVQCGFCTAGMIMTGVALLNRNPAPTNAEIKAEMTGNLCRCGVYDRIERATKRAAGLPLDPPSPTELLQPPPVGPRGTAQTGRTDPSSGSLKIDSEIDSWIRIDTDGTVTVFSGKVELGQDLRTSVAMICAEELGLELGRIRVIMGDTERTVNEGYTTSSMSLESTGPALRNAAAEARELLLREAGRKLGAAVEELTTEDGTVTDPKTGRSVTYWELYGGRKFNRKVGSTGTLKDPENYRVVGRHASRLDIRAKVTGGACFVHDLELDGMAHGRVVRPPYSDAVLVSVDEAKVRTMPGVLRIVRDGKFLGIIAEREEQAAAAAGALKRAAVWKANASLPEHEKLFDHMMGAEEQVSLIVDGLPVDGPVPPVAAPRGAACSLEATYFRPYHMHASLGPSAAVAWMNGGKLTVWSHSQGVYPLRAAIAAVLQMPKEAVHAIHMDGAGCYGHNGADDAALDAALLARALPGRPVSLKWTRQEENSWEPYGPAAVIKMQASLGDDRRVIDWNHDVWGYTYTGRARAETEASALLAAWHLERPVKKFIGDAGNSYHVGIHRNADPLYAFPHRRVVRHFLPDSPLRTSALRSLGSYANIFAIESFMDELAEAAGADPVEFRLRHLEDERARAVIEAVADKAGWRKDGGGATSGRGQGLGFLRYKNLQSYIAAVAEVEVNPSTGRISLIRGTVAVDAGQIVNPDAVSSQLEGIFVQSASWTLKEQVIFDRYGITSVDWHSYPILRFKDSPPIEVVLLDRPYERFLGVGEGGQGAVPAAIANAVY
ncbi:MAG: molybdopterin-dependent oxidoreductase, partial [Spirochaetales bacterium]|nr:molybdopterin-dependent oxidoreductase [Spirochaetales bacterium]